MVDQHPRRLDSWKSIAEYLGRDVRTVMRWAKGQGLPVGRVAGGKGRSVFAFTDDIDRWLTGRPDGEGVPPSAGNPAPPAAPLTEETPSPSIPRRPVWFVAAALATIGAPAVLAVWTLWPAPEALHISLDQRGVHRAEADGSSTLIYPFDPARVTATVDIPPPHLVTDVDADGAPDVVVAISHEADAASGMHHSGRLVRLDPDGTVRWTHEVADQVTFGARRFAGPWAVMDWRLSPGAGPRRIAVAARHYVWWPGFVALLDDAGQRTGTFVNAGWIEEVRWIDGDRIVATGFNNPRNGGMIAVLDARAVSGRSPDAPEPFACGDCPEGDPLQYMVFPRSELNVRTAGRFNRARIAAFAGKYLVHTEEITGPLESAVAMYEFDAGFKLVQASYSDTYWDLHRRLELEGRIDHAAEACPTRSGPASIESWSREGGWQRIAVPLALK